MWFLWLAAGQLVLPQPRKSGELEQMPTQELLGLGPAKTELNEPTLCDDVKQHSGFIKVSDTKKLFFWLFESRRTPAKDPTAMWLTGGPGCSSQLALVLENGPCSIKDGEAVKNQYSWNDQANVLWVDQPAGTGFSVAEAADYDTNEKQVGDDMYVFLQEFFKLFPQYNHDFMVVGESYGGHWVPVVTHRIFKGNQAKEGTHIDLTAWAIGNGLTNPLVQYPMYPKMAYNSGSAPSVITKDTYEEMEKAVPKCTKLIVACNSGSDDACNEAFNVCNEQLTGPYMQTGLNPYDMRIKCDVPGLCYNLTEQTNWLNRPDVQKQIGVETPWASCNMGVNAKFQADFLKGYADLVPDQLAAGIRVLIYAGDVDFICNWLGNKAWTLALQWHGMHAFNQAADKPWYVDGREAGKLRQHDNFSFLQVYQAGHMVPLDQPEAALRLFNEFAQDKLGEATELHLIA